MRLVRRRHLYTPWTASLPTKYNLAASVTASVVLPQTEHLASTIQDPRKVFDLLAAQRDMLSVFVTGRPRIADPSSLRTVFQFRQVSAVCAVDISWLVHVCLSVLSLVSLSFSPSSSVHFSQHVHL